MTSDARVEQGSADEADIAANHRGRFFVFEGIDGSGKSTVSRAITARLTAQGRPAVHTAEPTDSWVGQMVRRGNAEAVSPFTETLLYMADRAEHTALIAQWLEAGNYVVCDRYVGSTLAYQGVTLRPFLGNRAVDWLREVNRPYCITPTTAFFLEIDPDLAMDRLGSRKGREKFEKIDFLRKVDQIYRQLVQEDRFYVTIDASQPLEDVIETVWSFMAKY